MKRLAVLTVVLSAALIPWSASRAVASGGKSPALAVTPSMLAIPGGVFAPAKLLRSIVDPNSNNTNKKVWPRDEHSREYAAFGRVNGYYQSAKWSLAGSKSITVEYDGSIFKSASGAALAWHDGATVDLKFKGTRTLSCPPGLGSHCTRLSALFTTGEREVYDVFQRGSCLSEARAKSTQALIQKYQQQIYTTLAAIDRAALNAMARACGK